MGAADSIWAPPPPHLQLDERLHDQLPQLCSDSVEASDIRERDIDILGIHRTRRDCLLVGGEGGEVEGGALAADVGGG